MEEFPEPGVILYADFSLKYLSYLLPALLKATSIGFCSGSRSKNIAKAVRFEVDMALVLSTGTFRWSRGLKAKLQRAMHGKKPYFSLRCNAEEMSHIWYSSSIPRPLVHSYACEVEIEEERTTCEKVMEVEGELHCYVGILRGIVPGGDEMDLQELMAELGSYVACLELQVNILRSLVGRHWGFTA